MDESSEGLIGLSRKKAVVREGRGLSVIGFGTAEYDGESRSVRPKHICDFHGIVALFRHIDEKTVVDHGGGKKGFLVSVGIHIQHAGGIQSPV